MIYQCAFRKLAKIPALLDQKVDVNFGWFSTTWIGVRCTADVITVRHPDWSGAASERENRRVPTQPWHSKFVVCRSFGHSRRISVQ
jgi:hypothetical protein